MCAPTYQANEKLDDVAAEVQEIRRTVAEILATLRGLRKPQYSVEEVARLFHRAPYTVRAWIRRGRIRATRVNGTGPRGRLAVPREEIEKLVAEGLGSNVPDAVSGPA